MCQLLSRALRIASLSTLSQGCFRGLTQLLVYYLVIFANNVFADRTHLSDLLLLGFISDETLRPSLQKAANYRAFWADSRAPLGTRGFALGLQEMPLQ